MTYDGGKPHPVGDRGQRFEISVFDADKGERMIIGWSNDEDRCVRVCKSLVTRPGWSDAKYKDRHNPEGFGEMFATDGKNLLAIVNPSSEPDGDYTQGRINEEYTQERIPPSDKDKSDD